TYWRQDCPCSSASPMSPCQGNFQSPSCRASLFLRRATSYLGQPCISWPCSSVYSPAAGSHFVGLLCSPLWDSWFSISDQAAPFHSSFPLLQGLSLRSPDGAQ